MTINFKDSIDTSKAGLKTAYDAVVALRDKFKSIKQSLVDYKLEITGAGTPQGSPESVYQSTDNPNDITVIHDFNNITEAKAFAASEELKASMSKLGVKGTPQIWYTSQSS